MMRSKYSQINQFSHFPASFENINQTQIRKQEVYNNIGVKSQIRTTHARFCVTQRFINTILFRTRENLKRTPRTNRNV